MFKVISSLHDGVRCGVRLNGLKTYWLTVSCGLIQGCNLSTLLFNLFTNDLFEIIRIINRRIDINGEIISTLLYVYDPVLLASSEKDLQIILNELNDLWDIKMMINKEKSNIVRFKTQPTER